MSQSPIPANELPKSELAFQQKLLSGVARTFALTTPQLPHSLRALFGNAYLLCRINDTIEDDAALTISQKDEFSGRFIALVCGEVDDKSFGSDLAGRLSASTLASEKELITQAARVVGIKRRFSAEQQSILEYCVSTMSRGMVEFQRHASINGLADLSEFNRYCYHVAGIVGETLTALMCDYSEEIQEKRNLMVPLAISFGQGLQMINILKDMWEDRERGICWLPREIFQSTGVDLQGLDTTQTPKGFDRGVSELVAIAHHHLSNAQRYIELIPPRETGYRRYCLWAAGMALATLRKIHTNPGYRSGQEVKITRTTVRTIIVITSVFSRSNRILNLLFNFLRRDLPHTNAGAGLVYVPESNLNQSGFRP